MKGLDGQKQGFLHLHQDVHGEHAEIKAEQHRNNDILIDERPQKALYM